MMTPLPSSLGRACSCRDGVAMEPLYSPAVGFSEGLSRTLPLKVVPHNEVAEISPGW